MFAAKQFTIRTLALVTIYAAFLLFIAEGHRRTGWGLVGVWLVPVALAAVIRRRSTLAITCMSLNLVLYATARTRTLATWKQPGYEAICDATGAVFFGTFFPAATMYGNGYCPEERDDIIRVVLAASVMYAIVGVAFSYCFTPRKPRPAAQDGPGPEGTG